MRGQQEKSIWLLLWLGAAAACAPQTGGAERQESAAAPAGGLVFHQSEADLGRIYSGERRVLRFPFEIAEIPVRISSLQTTCGCVAPRVEMAGKAVEIPAELPAGGRGEVVTEFRSAGFSGVKESAVTVFGSGPGTPAELRIRAELQPWFRVSPENLVLGTLREQDQARRQVTVEGPQPFRLLACRSLPAGLEIGPLPSPESAARQVLEVRLEPSGEQGPHTWFAHLEADNGMDLVLPIQYETASELWLRPYKWLNVGVVAAGAPIFAAAEVGVESGELELPEVRIEGIAGATAERVTLQERRSYRIRMRFPAELSPGPLRGRLLLRLRHVVAGEVREVDRELRILGLIEKPAQQ